MGDLNAQEAVRGASLISLFRMRNARAYFVSHSTYAVTSSAIRTCYNKDWLFMREQ